MVWKYVQYDGETGKRRTIEGGGGGGGNVDDVLVNGISVVDENHNAQIVSYKEVTQAEYNALPASKETDGILYCIKDVGGADSFPPLIFSDEEREIGVWIDGKPVYEKTVIVPVSSCTISNKVMTIPFISANEKLLRIVDAFTSDGTYYRIEYGGETHVSNSTDANYIRFGWFYGSFCLYTASTNYWANLGDITVIYQYTKTTDVPGSGTWTTQGGYAHHYSTSEKVIGTWIDGKPLYEKTFDLNNTSIANKTWTEVSNTLPLSTTKMTLGGTIIDEYGQSFAVNVGNMTTYIGVYIVDATRTRNYKYLTLQYTKTTD